MAPAGDPGPQSGQADQPAAVAEGRLGQPVRAGDPLPTPVHGPAPAQARGRSGPSAAAADRARDGLPAPARGRARRARRSPPTLRRRAEPAGRGGPGPPNRLPWRGAVRSSDRQVVDETVGNRWIPRPRLGVTGAGWWTPPSLLRILK